MKLLKMKYLFFIIFMLGWVPFHYAGAAPSFVPARIVKKARIPYPKKAEMQGKQGVTWVKVKVGINGKPLKVLVVTSSGSKLLDKRAEEIAAKSLYKPEMKQGVPAASWLLYSIHSRLPKAVQQALNQIQTLKEKIAHSPDKWRLYNKLAMFYMAQSNWSKAEETYQIALKKWSNNPALAAGLARVDLDKGERIKAIPDLERAVKLNPTDPTFPPILADLLVSAHHFNQALPVLEKAHLLNPKNVYMLQDLGYVYYQKHEYLKSASAYRKALVLKPDDPSLEVNLGNALLSAGKFKECIPLFIQAIKLEPENPNLLYSLGVSYFYENKPQEARDSFRKAVLAMKVQHAPSGNLATVYLELGIIDFQLKDQKEGVHYLSRAYRLDPENPLYIKALAKGYYNTKQYKKAYSLFQKIVKIQPQNAKTYELMGSIDSVEHHWNQAEKNWKLALKFYRKEKNKVKIKKIQKTLNRLKRLLKEKQSQGD